jgi:TetR/AcrR family fatty acid metabolism transcriptional regulator
VRVKTPAQADKMLDAAARLFARQRFHQVRMEDIAEEAGVGKGTLYRYFRDKEELYIALLARASEQFAAELRDAMAEAEGPRDRLEAMIAAIIHHFDEHPHLLDLIQRAEVLAGSEREFPWQLTRIQTIRLVTDLFRAARQTGDFSIRDPDLSALMLLGGLRSVIRFGKRPRPRDLAARIVDAFLSGADVGSLAATAD